MDNRPALSAIVLGEAVGKIAAFAARTLHEQWPHLDLEELVATFTSDSALTALATRYADGLDSGKAPGEAAADAGVALIHAWAEARLAARALLDAQQAPTH